MRRTKTKRPGLGRIHFAVVALSLLFVISPPLAYATRPYFKAFGADVFTGGWFNTVACSNGTEANYQEYSSAIPQNGGIVTYARTHGTGQSNGGASSAFGAFSLGLIDGDWDSPTYKGFYSSGATATASVSTDLVNRLSFSNYDDGTGSSMQFGGNFQGAVRQGHCIPDYYTTKSIDATPFSGTTPATAPDVSTAVGNYINSAPAGNVDLNSNGVDTIPPGNALTIFIKGNVFIHQNITYSDSSTASTVPKFALVVQGSIYIGPAVTRLDGLYIAQPNPTDPTPVTSNTGIIWTCRPNSPSQYTFAQMITNCGSKLTINGALIAKQVNFLRIPGDTATATANEASSSPNIAEVVNYTPAMVIGGPFFNPPASSGSLKIQSLVSLPPTF